MVALLGYRCAFAMNPEIKQLLEQKLSVIVRDLVAELAVGYNAAWDSFDLIAAGARASLANASRDARAKLQLVIDEYLLSVRPQPSATQSKTLKSRLFDSVSLKPGAFGLSIDLKNLFTRKRQD